LFLQGDDDQPWKNKWVVAVDPQRPEVRRLFPLDWEGSRHLFGGPGVMLDGDLVHAGAVHNGAGLQPGGAFVVRRRLADGLPHWIFTADAPVTAVDELDGTIYVAFNSGEIVALDAGTGTVRWRDDFLLDGQSVVPLSLATASPDRVVVGTTDGRIADCRTS
jgi:hypothetical protein